MNTAMFREIEVSSSTKVNIASTSGLLLLILLRLNRVIVPILLRYLKRQRIHWTNRIPTDVAQEMKNNPNLRILCAGPCCRQSYMDTFPTSKTSCKVLPTRVANHVKTPSGNDVRPCDSTKESTIPTVTGWLLAAQDTASHQTDKTELRQSKLPESERPSSDTSGDIDWTEEEKLYFRLRVDQEGRHRAKRITFSMRPCFLARFYTIFMLVFFSVVISAIVFHIFIYDLWSQTVFFLSLFYSGLLSEWDSISATPLYFPRWMTSPEATTPAAVVASQKVDQVPFKN